MNKDVLKQIGLTEYEINLYLTLLEKGEISAYELAEKNGMYRQATYDALNRLIEKGYVNSVKEGKARLFKAVNPEIILDYLNETSDNFKDIIPQLLNLQSKSKSNLDVETYRGKNVLRIAFKDIIRELKKSKGENLCTAVDESFGLNQNYETNNIIYNAYERDMLKYKIKERVIIKEGVKGIFKKGTSYYKHIPAKYFNSNPTQIYGDNVQIVVWGNPDHLIIIRNKDVADSYRRQFELIWKVAK